MTHLIIGDIHGCYDELLELLDKAGLSDDDPIISVGDLVNRGPDSARVLDFFRATPNALAIRGNHEQRHLDARHHDRLPSLGVLLTRWQLDTDYPAACNYMASLPLALDLPDALVVHGFYEPGVPLDQQCPDVLIGETRAEIDLQERFDRPWYDLYDGDKPLVVGHRDYSGGLMQACVFRDRVYCIDSRCVYGGSLTGLLLPDFRLISVPSRDDHWGTIRGRYFIS